MLDSCSVSLNAVCCCSTHCCVFLHSTGVTWAPRSPVSQTARAAACCLWMKLEFLVAGVVLFTSSYFLLLLLPEKSQTTKHLVKHDWWTRESFHEWILNFFMLRGQKHISQWMITVLQSCWIISCCFHPLLLLLFYILDKAGESERGKDMQQTASCGIKPRPLWLLHMIVSTRGAPPLKHRCEHRGSFLVQQMDFKVLHVHQSSQWRSNLQVGKKHPPWINATFHLLSL